MKRLTLILTVALVLAVPVAALSGGGNGGGGGGGYGGGSGSNSGGGTGGGGQPADLEGPLNDKGSDQGVLYGDLFTILRYRGGETKQVPKYNEDGDPVFETVSWTTPAGNTTSVLQQEWEDATAVGGEPILTEDFVVYTIINEDTGLPEINSATGDIYFRAPTASQCVQPVASYLVWGDISAKTGLDFNLIPLAKTYDSTWGRTECEIGEGTLDPDTGLIEIDEWFLEPDEDWSDPINGEVNYTEGVLWEELVQEVSFGRLNIARAPDAVLESSFDEAIRSINSAEKVELDASGRLLLTKLVYSTSVVDPDTGEPELLEEPVVKAIDSPLENLALYVKLLKDGHLVTPADERLPIDRSLNGGIPLSKLIGLEDGPSQSLRPTVDIQKLRDWGLGQLVDVGNAEITYYAYYHITYAQDGGDGACVPVSREVLTTSATCSTLPEYDECGNPLLCSGPWDGIESDVEDLLPTSADMPFAASFLAAAADKTGFISVDMIVYLNSILGLNKVYGYSATDADGDPLDDATDYSIFPVYFDFASVSGYQREATLANRGEVLSIGGGGGASTYTGSVLVLQPTGNDGFWQEKLMPIFTSVQFRSVDIGWSDEDTLIENDGVDNILGFSQMADDDLGVVEFVHTYQIPERREMSRSWYFPGRFEEAYLAGESRRPRRICRLLYIVLVGIGVDETSVVPGRVFLMRLCLLFY